MTDIDELEIVSRLGRDVEPPRTDVRLDAREIVMRRIADSAPTTTTPARVVRPLRRRRFALTAAGAAAIGIAASLVVLTSVAGPTLPGGLGAKPASAQEQLRHLAAQSATNAVAFPSTRQTRSLTVPASGAAVTANCTETAFSLTDSASKCDDGRAADPIGSLTASTSGITPATTPGEVAAIIAAQPAHAGALPHALSNNHLRADTRAEILRLAAAEPGLEVEQDATTVLGDTGTRFTLPNGPGTWAVTLADDGFVLEITISNALMSGAPASITTASSPPTFLSTLPADVERLRDELTSQASDLEATYPPPSVPGPSISCATPIDPTIGHVDATAFGGWVGQHCVVNDG